MEYFSEGGFRKTADMTTWLFDQSQIFGRRNLFDVNLFTSIFFSTSKNCETSLNFGRRNFVDVQLVLDVNFFGRQKTLIPGSRCCSSNLFCRQFVMDASFFLDV